MPPRVRLPTSQLIISKPQYICRRCRYASLATATTPAPAIHQSIEPVSPILRHSPTQPPSYKPPEFRKTQLHRQYQSLLRSSPLLLIFQHNNLKSTEWIGVRRELAIAMQKLDAEMEKDGKTDLIGKDIRLQVIQTGIFASALKVVEFWEPKFEQDNEPNLRSTSSTSLTTDLSSHGLSREAWEAGKNRELKRGLEPLLSGPLAILALPTVSPQYLKAALSILAPSSAFPAPKRKANPGYHEPAVQIGIQKLLLLAARVEGKVFDTEGTKWIGGIQGGLDGLRAQLVAMLSGTGAQLTNTLGAASRSLYLTLEGRKGMLEEEGKASAGGS